MDKDDQVRLSVQSPEQDFPIIILYRCLADTFLSKVERVLQSYEELHVIL